MLVQVRYEQKQHFLGIYTFYRIITFKKPNRIFKTKIKKELFSSFGMEHKEYIRKVETNLNFDGATLLRLISMDIQPHLANPESVRTNINSYEREIQYDYK